MQRKNDLQFVQNRRKRKSKIHLTRFSYLTNTYWMFIMFFIVSKCFRNVSSEQSLKAEGGAMTGKAFYKGNQSCVQWYRLRKAYLKTEE